METLDTGQVLAQKEKLKTLSKRQGQVGKGSNPRRVKLEKYESNFDSINWNSKRGDK